MEYFCSAIRACPKSAGKDTKEIYIQRYSKKLIFRRLLTKIQDNIQNDVKLS